MKDKIIHSVLVYIRTGDLIHKQKAIESISDMAKYYHVRLTRKVVLSEINIVLEEFVINSKGYNVTLNQLYNKLH